MNEDRWPYGVDPACYREVSSVVIVFPPGDPLGQMAAVPDLPPGTIIERRDADGLDVEVTA